MFGGKKKRSRLQQIRDALQQVQSPGMSPGQQDPFAGGQQYGPGQMSRYESMIGQLIERQLARNPLFAGNPAIAGHMEEIIQAAKRDPQGFQQRMRQLSASGVTPETVTADQIAMLIGQSPGMPPGTPPPTGEAFPPLDTPLPPPPTRSNRVAGQTGGGWTPAGTPHEFTAPPAGPFSGQPGGQTGGGYTPPGVPREFTAPPAGPFSGPQPGTFGAPPAPPQPPASHGNPLAELDELAARHSRGELTDAEFEDQKRRLLGG
jgi:hypothetical protein